MLTVDPQVKKAKNIVFQLPGRASFSPLYLAGLKFQTGLSGFFISNESALVFSPLKINRVNQNPALSATDNRNVRSKPGDFSRVPRNNHPGSRKEGKVFPIMGPAWCKCCVSGNRQNKQVPLAFIASRSL